MLTAKIHTTMNFKNPLDNWIGFISGVGGYGFINVQFVWHDELIRICVAGVVAFVAGMMGVAGKYLFVWAWKRIHLYLKK